MIVNKISKKILSNGLTILTAAYHRIPTVSVQLWYNVGSKDELTQEKGIAHLIEHMIFKGTTNLSETDINLITRKLSGYSNAFTSHDYTGYLFDFPSQHWHQALHIMADCMNNCIFDNEFLSSELKAVIQELKMYRDDYGTSLIERMMSNIFHDHPYRYPVIGYKQDLWSLERTQLLNFYKKHYVPNNATLVVIGDADESEVFDQAEKIFGAIPAQPYKKHNFYHSFDISSTITKIYQDIQQPLIILTWLIPGIKEKKDYILDVMSWVIGSGKGSRLYRKLVNELAVVTELDNFVYDLFDHSIFCIQFQPTPGIEKEKIISLIQDELDHLANYEIETAELSRALKKVEMDSLCLRENNQKLAYLIGKHYLATNDETYFTTYGNMDRNMVIHDLHTLIKTYIRPSVMHQGEIVPLPKEESVYWLAQQKISDDEDNKILSKIVRESSVEQSTSYHQIKVNPPKKFVYPKPDIFTLSNGLKVVYLYEVNSPKIDIILDFKAKHFFDPDHKYGLSTIIADLLQEGTKNLDASQFALDLEKSGISFETFPGHISMTCLQEDTEKGFSLLLDVVSKAALTITSLEKIKTRILADIDDFWDDPLQFSGQLLKEKIYQGHPYAKPLLGTKETINNINLDDVHNYYRSWITPRQSRIAIVGSIKKNELLNILEKTLVQWQGPDITDIHFPLVAPIKNEETIQYPIQRDQVTLCFGKITVNRTHPDFDKLLIFDQIFSGGILNSMSSRLFALREQTGLFYSINGSLLAGAGKQPGILFIKTIVSLDNYKQAEKSIRKIITNGANDLTDTEVEEAKNGIINSLVNHFSSGQQTAASLLFIDHFGFKDTYFDKRPEQLFRITKDEIQKAALNILQTDGMVTIRVGRVNH